MSDASSRRPGSTWSRHSPLAALLALLLGLFFLGVTAGMPRAAADATSSARVSLQANAPAVASSGEPVTVSGRVTNTGSTAIEHPVVRVSISKRLLDTRTAGQQWMAGTLELPLAQVATGETGSLAAGSSAPFSVVIPGKKLKFSYGVASLPMTVTVTDGASSAASAIRGMTRSTLELQNQQMQSPLRVTVVIPLTLPADPALFGPTGTARAKAWEDAVGPDSTVQRTLDAFRGQPVIFAVDPSLLDPPAASDDNVPAASASATGSSSSSSAGPAASSTAGGSSPDTSAASSGSSAGTPAPTSTGSGSAATATGGSTDPSGGATGDGSGTTSGSTSAPSSQSSPTTAPTTPQDRLDAAVDSLADRLGSLDDGQSVWWLPSDDPDLAALQKGGTVGRSLVARDFSRALPSGFASLGDTRLIWPVGDVAGSVVTSYTKEFAARSKSSAVALLPNRAVTRPQYATAAHRAAGTSGVLTYDGSLSSIFSKATTSPGTQTSQLLTQTMALYLQSPGTARSLTLVAPRGDAADPAQLAAQVQALRTANWVTVRTGAQTATALHSAPTTTVLRTPRKSSATAKLPAPAVTSEQLADLADSRTSLAALQSVLVGGADVIPPRERGLDVIGSARWRGAAKTLSGVAEHDNNAVTAMLRKLSIRSSTINFFADSGDISVTVANELNRPVHDVQLQLQPRKFLIRVTDSVQPVDIDARARAAAHFHIEAVGGGTVPVDAVLRAPDGTSLTDPDAPPQLKINVHPTSGWIMWVLGVLAGLILAIGLWRAVRRGPRTASAPASADAPTPNDAIVDAGRTTTHPPDSAPTDDESTEPDD